VLLLGGPDSDLMAASRSSARIHGIAVEELDPREVQARWPVFRLPGTTHGLLEPDAGFVVPEHGVAAGLEIAARCGADLRFDTPITAIKPSEDHAVVRCGHESIEVDRVVVTAGAWTSRLLPSLSATCRLEPQRKVIAWCRPRPGRAAALGHDRMPAWLLDDGGAFGDGVYYGVPTWPGQVGPEGLKVGFHGPGPAVDPDANDRACDPGIVARFHRDLSTFLPDALEPPHASATCLYTMTADRHFVIDRVPGAGAIIVAAGFSGHGYKFAPVIGDILADLALDGRTRHPAGFLTIGDRSLAT
jgi:sarcosine oxidase